MNIHTFFRYIKERKYNLLIVIMFFLFLYFNLITLNRFIYFFFIIFIAFFYKNTIEFFYKKKIENIYILNFIFIINKYKNPILYFLPKIEIFILNKSLNFNIIFKFLIFILYLFIINPIKIFFHKFYGILFYWKIHNLVDIFFGRLFGLILSILIFTNIINFLKECLHVNIFGLIFIYLLMVSFLSEFVRQSRSMNLIISLINKIFFVNTLTLYNILLSRYDVIIFSNILKSNRIDEWFIFLEIKENDDIHTFYKKNYLSYVFIGGTWNCIKNFYILKSKPNYKIYSDLYDKMNFSLDHINHYISLEKLN
jgi:hypothetical protein